MTRSFVMIKTETAGGVSGIKKGLGEVMENPEVVEAYKTFGPFDIIAITDTKSRDELTKLIDKIRRIEGVKDTDTYITY